MINETDIHKKILIDLIDLLTKDYGEDVFLIKARFLLSKEEIQVGVIKNILYGIISFYLIDEITLQPVEKMNFIDMGSYYYRSESYSVDYPNEFHERYQIPHPHLERKFSIFYSNKNFIQNYLKAESGEELISVSIIKTEDPDLKIASSRQLFLIEYFLLHPQLFKEMLLANYSGKFKDSEVFKIRKENNFAQFLCSRITEDLSDGEIRTNLSKLLNKDQDYILTSSGTSANELVIQYLNSNNQKDFYHKYWYFENLSSNQSHYFHEIETDLMNYDNFYINIRATNFIDMNGPVFVENIEKELNVLISKLEKIDKNFNLVIDVTSNIFFNIQTNSKNLNIIKTVSLSKYQEGINTGFAGLVIADNVNIFKMRPVADYFGFTMNELDKRFLFLPDINQYRERILKINDFTNKQTLNYCGWEINPIGLSLAIIPNKETFDYQIKKFSNQVKISDRKFAWLIRDKVNELIKRLDLKDIYFGDSFLFPTSRINIQGPIIKASDHSENLHTFKYRLPRISPGYEIDLKNEDKYNEFYKGIIDIYIEEYNKL
jgi:hypothetical protein